MEPNKSGTVGVLEIADLDQVLKLPKGLEKAYVLCAGNEQLSIQDAQGMCASGTEYEFVTCASRDERLVCLGGILESAEACVILGNGLPVPSRYTGKARVIQTKNQAAKKAKPRSRTKPLAKTDPPQGHARGNVPDMPYPENKPETALSTAKSPDAPWQPEEMEPDEAALFAILGIQSEDIGFGFSTAMLMGRILMLAAEAETAEDLLSSIRNGIRNSDKILRACAGHELEILALGHDTK